MQYTLSQAWSGDASLAVPQTYITLWILNMSIVVLGLILKGTGVPEVFWPGKFDYMFSSHQLWVSELSLTVAHTYLWQHLCVNGGNSLLYFTWLEYLKWRHTTPCTAR